MINNQRYILIFDWLLLRRETTQTKDQRSLFRFFALAEWKQPAWQTIGWSEKMTTQKLLDQISAVLKTAKGIKGRVAKVVRFGRPWYQRETHQTDLDTHLVPSAQEISRIFR